MLNEIQSDSEYLEENNPESDLDQDEPERQKIRENLSTLSFEELIKLKEKLGSKVYNQTVYGTKPKKPKDPKELKRVNKNRPREISSKIRPKMIKLLPNASRAALPSIKKHYARDPRFDPLCGTFDNQTFKANYQFVNKIRQKEKIELEKEYKECTNIERKNTIKLLIQRVENQLREEEKISMEKHKDYIEKKEIREKIKRGEKPVFKKKSVKRLEGLVEKYEELKKTNRLQKHIQKRAKKIKIKDRKNIEKQNL